MENENMKRRWLCYLYEHYILWKNIKNWQSYGTDSVRTARIYENHCFLQICFIAAYCSSNMISDDL